MTEHSRDKSKIRFVLLEGVHESAEQSLRAAGYTNVAMQRGALSGDALRAAIADAHFVGIRSRTQLTREIISQARVLAAIGCFCIGTDQVDLAAARDLGIPVFNSPFSNTRSVAELVLAEMILLLRGVAARNAELHRGRWSKSAAGSHEARGKTLGIVGYGHIGTQLSILAENLGMRVVFFDIASKLALGNARAAASLDELLRNSDVVTLHVPDTDVTRGMIGANQIRLMRDGAVLLNASRGKVVRIDDLAAALRSGKLSGAALDVFPVEPTANDEEFVSPLREFDNVILTPHIGGSTEEAQEKIGQEVADKLVRYSDNGSTESAVNFPQVALPEHPGKHRVLHVHQNVPGVLAAINRAFSDSGINVSGQYLRTDDAIGYVVMDIDQESSAVARDRLREIPATIRCRVLH
jgi:D-3-phosphoglycerate dehydrogenase / 2-oxoglutarate reductase